MARGPGGPLLAVEVAELVGVTTPAPDGRGEKTAPRHPPAEGVFFGWQRSGALLRSAPVRQPGDAHGALEFGPGLFQFEG